MDIVEFTKCMAHLAEAVGKPLSMDGHEVYFDLLCDLPLEVLQIACKRVALEHRWATFPTPAEIRQSASETLRGQVTELTPAEAWSMAWGAVGRIDPEVQGSVERGTKGLPRLVVEAMHAFGMNALCYGKEPLGVVRGQFLDMYEQLLSRDRRKALLPAPLKAQIERIGAIPAEPAKMIAYIGKVPE